MTFHYTRHEDRKPITERIPALDFIKRLIVHIPKKHFKMLRYYGIYAKHHKQEKKLHKCLLKRNDIFVRFLIGDIPFFFLLDMILKCPKGHFYVGVGSLPQKNSPLNDSEKSWMDKSISTCAFS